MSIPYGNDTLQPGLDRAAAYLRKKGADMTLQAERLRIQNEVIPTPGNAVRDARNTALSAAVMYAKLAAEIEALTQRPAASDNVGEEK